MFDTSYSVIRYDSHHIENVDEKHLLQILKTIGFLSESEESEVFSFWKTIAQKFLIEFGRPFVFKVESREDYSCFECGDKNYKLRVETSLSSASNWIQIDIQQFNCPELYSLMEAIIASDPTWEKISS